MKKYYRFTKLKIRQQNLKNLLFDPNESALKKALSVALGVFIGVVPIWGMQIASALISAQYFKLNKTLAVLGSYINLTPLFPLILLFSLKIGFALTGNMDSTLAFSDMTMETAKTYFWMFLLGSIPIAIIASLFFGAVTFTAASFIRVTIKQPLR